MILLVRHVEHDRRKKGMGSYAEPGVLFKKFCQAAAQSMFQARDIKGKKAQLNLATAGKKAADARMTTKVKRIFFPDFRPLRLLYSGGVHERILYKKSRSDESHQTG